MPCMIYTAPEEKRVVDTATQTLTLFHLRPQFSLAATRLSQLVVARSDLETNSIYSHAFLPTLLFPHPDSTFQSTFQSTLQTTLHLTSPTNSPLNPSINLPLNDPLKHALT